MRKISVEAELASRQKRSNQLFYLFLGVFIVTSALAAISLVIALFIPDYYDAHASVRQYTGMLYATLIAEVAAAVFALSRDLFGTTTLTELKLFEESSTNRKRSIDILLQTIENIIDGSQDVQDLDIEELRAEHLPEARDLTPVREG